MAFNALRNIFSRSSSDARAEGRPTLVGPRIPRHSSGWAAMLKHLKDGESLLVLDIGPTSPSTVNFLTGLGHSIYMADLVTEANRAEAGKPASEEVAGEENQVDAFFGRHMEFSGRVFDVVLLWTTLDYLPERFLESLIARLHDSIQPGGRILAFFHTKNPAPESIYYRYHATETDNVETQEAERFAVQQIFTNRKVEKLFSAFSSCKFFLAKDNVNEVLITR